MSEGKPTTFWQRLFGRAGDVARSDEAPAKEDPPPPPPPPAIAPPASVPPPQSPAVAEFSQAPAGQAMALLEANLCGAMFPGAGEALAFLGALGGARLAARAVCRRGPQGRIWVEVAAPPEKAATLARLAGGRAFTGLVAGAGEEPTLGAPRAWVAMLPDGKPMPPRILLPQGSSRTVLVTGRDVERLERTLWTHAPLSALLESTSLRAERARARSEIVAVVPPELARWVVGRCLALGLVVALAPAERRELAEEGEGAGVVWMRVHAPKGVVPASWISRLADLPGVVVAYAAGGDARLFVDARCDAPAWAPFFASFLDRDEVWVLGAVDVGHASLRLLGEMVPGGSLVTLPDRAAAPIEMGRAAARLPEPIRVELVHDGRATRIDGVLLDADELAWARQWLVRLPAGDAVYLAFGEDRHLLLAADETASRVPFGIALSRIGPGAIYVEQGLGFFPAMPSEARRRAFGPKEGELVVVTRGGSFVFRIDSLSPAWSAWIAEPPPMHAEPFGQATKKLAEIERQARADGERAAARKLPVEFDVQDGDIDEAKIREQAARALAGGSLARAAQLYERIGDLRAAAQLYERAARGE
ncbi:hypothetical protein [Polyangium jinanense]|uniref:FtsH ternary system domain-containing protein n=1 Tax=Polyangium jinanense TaxID=2829994 RepID=A0A9X3X9Q2_9BACT|nr:hypothetical protein [Polyangium jinanense]MDC3957552.1 hypothetical protein [Polyangium jinanense]MDC3984958.1 hypothetical protein [Polyangium jinanense]